jgi:uroporphyrinogen-III decarboxylase
MMHFALDPAQTVYCLLDRPAQSQTLMRMHEEAQLDLARQIATAGVPAIMAMDNLDTMFHPPRYVESYSASFYEQASRVCHDHGSTFFIHACGNQRANLALIAGLGVDGLEGVAFPPLGDVDLDEAMRLTGDQFIITGGISATQFELLKTRADVFAYVRDLLTRMRPFAHRFILSSSCNTPISASWETICQFRDAWREYRDL